MHLTAFRVGDIYLGIDVDSTREVGRATEVLEVPMAPPLVLGLLNRRGTVITLTDGRQLLDLTPSPPLAEQGGYDLLIVEHDGDLLGVVVDELVDTIEVDEEDLLPVAQSLSPALRSVAVGVYRQESELLVVTSAAKILAVICGHQEPTPQLQEVS